MTKLLTLILFALPLMGLSDPAAGQACASGSGGYITSTANPYLSSMDGEDCQRKLARVVQWRNAYAGMSEEQRTLQAVDAVEDMFDSACLYGLVKRLSGDDGISPTDARLWVGARLNALGTGDTLDWLAGQCPAPADPITEPDDQGERVSKLIVFRGAGLANGIRQRWPVLPRVGSVPPVIWAGMTERVCTLANDGTLTFFESQYDFHEATLHAIHAIIAGEDQANETSYLTQVYFVDSEADLPCVSITEPTP